MVADGTPGEKKEVSRCPSCRKEAAVAAIRVFRDFFLRVKEIPRRDSGQAHEPKYLPTGNGSLARSWTQFFPPGPGQPSDTSTTKEWHPGHLPSSRWLEDSRPPRKNLALRPAWWYLPQLPRGTSIPSGRLLAVVVLSAVSAVFHVKRANTLGSPHHCTSRAFHPGRSPDTSCRPVQAGHPWPQSAAMSPLPPPEPIFCLWLYSAVACLPLHAG